MGKHSRKERAAEEAWQLDLSQRLAERRPTGFTGRFYQPAVMKEVGAKEVTFRDGKRYEILHGGQLRRLPDLPKAAPAAPDAAEEETP